MAPTSSSPWAAGSDSAPSTDARIAPEGEVVAVASIARSRRSASRRPPLARVRARTRAPSFSAGSVLRRSSPPRPPRRRTGAPGRPIAAQVTAHAASTTSADLRSTHHPAIVRPHRHRSRRTTGWSQRSRPGLPGAASGRARGGRRVQSHWQNQVRAGSISRCTHTRQKPGEDESQQDGTVGGTVDDDDLLPGLPPARREPGWRASSRRRRTAPSAPAVCAARASAPRSSASASRIAADQP